METSKRKGGQQQKDLVIDAGVAPIHTIDRVGGSGATSPWIRKYAFSGGHTPTLSEVATAVEQSGLAITGIEALLCLRYAEAPAFAGGSASSSLGGGQDVPGPVGSPP